MIFMGKNYYVFSSGRVKRHENTILIEYQKAGMQQRKFIPVENIDQIFFLGEVDLNSKFLDFAAKNNIVLHFFNYYGYYTGSFYPREKFISGELLVRQVEHYLDSEKRLTLARKFVEGAVHNFKRNIEKRGFDITDKISEYLERTKYAKTIPELMSCEAHARKLYYSTWEEITGWPFEERSMQPPLNELNALISFGNSLTYSIVLKELYFTHLNPTISYLHEPGTKRFSLALDIAEIFKPIFVDRIIFKLINLKKIDREKHFLQEARGVFLNEEGRRLFIEEFENMLQQTILHRKLKRKIKYQSLIRLEAYKIIKHLLGEDEYRPLKVWW
ncbi:CRISPR-associated protein, Cas1 family [Thermotoga neapolitana DSM 4359]|uniref:CRISPR-associated endonuclease Cas1 n=2 Tax=Thermotogaceae TaxID=188709 RepID=B9K7F7_THENN|nr:CRISPR-associated protein, Cas1 family [Thermotoga neapolitana DSM 4359]